MMSNKPCRIGYSLTLFVFLISIVGCPDAGPAVSTPSSTPTKGPHRGPLASLDGQLYAEFVTAVDRNQASIYLLEKDGQKYHPIPDTTVVTMSIKTSSETHEIVMKPGQEEGDPQDMASGFVGWHETITKDLQPKQVKVRLKINGKEVTGVFGQENL